MEPSAKSTMKLNPQGIQGNWQSGIVLDWHTVDSVCVGENEFGHPIFETQRSALGELLFQFKYRNDSAALQKLLAAAHDHLAEAKGRFDVIAPVPPSTPNRTVTAQLAEGLTACIGGSYAESALAKRELRNELKSVDDPAQRDKLLRDAFVAVPELLAGKSVLLVDDIYRSGATLEAATDAAYNIGGADAVYVFAVTRTRVNR